MICPSSKTSISTVRKDTSPPRMTTPIRAAPPTCNTVPTPRKTTLSPCKRPSFIPKLLIIVLLMVPESLGEQTTFRDNGGKSSIKCDPKDMVPDKNTAVYGTGNYSRNSAICLSALHAGFLTSRGGEVKYASSENNKVIGTVRNRVMSKSREVTKETYYFTGEKPTIEMDPKKVTIILHDSYDATQMKLHFMCYGGRHLTNWKHLKTIRMRQGDSPLNFESNIDRSNTHALVCEGEHPWQDSRAAFVFPPCNEEYDGQCSRYLATTGTFTGSVGGPLTLHLHRVLTGDPTTLYYRRLPDAITDTADLPLDKTFTSLEIGQDGIYFAGKDNFNGGSNVHGAYFDIMVRDCPDQRWGPDCSNWCPDCQNGGQCHPSTGKCICAPGFRGSTCSSGCKDKDKFGPECQYNCSELRNSGNMKKSCLGITACVPFPRGCSCLPGYKGPRCDSECEKSEYGCGCSYKCNFCKWDSCNSWNGRCTHGCKNDVPCEGGFPLDLPRLEQPPTIEDLTDKSAEVRFKAVEYKNSSIYIFSYIVQYRKESSEEWNTGATVKQGDVESTGWGTARISGLHPGFQYVIRILVITNRGFNDERSNKRILKSGPIVTPCTEFRDYFETVSIQSNQTSAVFTIENKMHYGNPCNTSIRIYKLVSSSGRQGRRLSLGFQPMVTVTGLTPDTCYTVNGYIKNKDSQASLKDSKFCTLPNPPSEVEDLKVNPLVDTAQISFEKPKGGKVTYYKVYVESGDGNNCQEMPEYNPKEFNISVDDQLPVEVSPLSPNRNYKTCVWAGNSGGLGRKECTTFKTRPKAPDNSLIITSCSNDGCKVEVKGNCSQYHGENIQIIANLQGIRACDHHHWNQNVTASRRNTKIYEALFKKLGCGITYNISFTLQNEVGVGQSVNGNFTTESCDPPQPRIATVTASSDTSLIVLWNDTCPSNGVIEYYDIAFTYRYAYGWYKIYEIKKGNCHKLYSDRCYEIGGLPKGKRITIQIRANNGKESSWSPNGYGQTLETEPGPPSGVVVLRKETSLDFNISLPISPNGKLLRCIVQLSSNQSCTAELEEDVAFAFCMIKGLNQGSGYMSSIRCDNSKVGKSLEERVATLPVPPHLVTELEFLSELSTDTNFTITLPGLDQQGEGKSEVAVLLYNASSTQENPDFNFTSFFLKEIEGKSFIFSSKEDKSFRNKRSTEFLKECHMKEEGPVRVAALIKMGKENQPAGTGVRFTVGDGREYGGFCNTPLIKGSTYYVAAVACVELDGERKCTEKKLQDVVYVTLYAPPPWGAVIIPVLLILVILLVVLILHRKGYLQKYLPRKESSSSEFHIPITEQVTRNNQKKNVSHPVPDLPLPPAPLNVQLFQHPRNQDTQEFRALQPAVKDTSVDYPWCLPSRKTPPYFDDDSAYLNIGHRIQEGEVESFLNDVIVRSMFEQFTDIPVTCTEKSENDGQNQNNRKKNRYKNNLPYDQTRVRLSVIDNDPYSDYINANHIQGCGGKLKYIATQGPKDEKVCTIGDFWQMVMEQNVKAIIMVANFVEGNRVKVGEYYIPGRVTVWDGHRVSVMKQKRMPHYTVSTIKVEAVDGSASEVKHYHYLSWPDHNIPLEARSLACMIREVIQTHHEGSVVVHCSAGIGRTGTVLFVLLLHEMLEIQDVIDPIRILAQMRHCRGRLLENETQFRFALLLFDEVLFGKRTLRSKGDISANVILILHQQSQAEFQRLCSLASGISYTLAQGKEIASLNRNPKILPADGRRVFLNVVSNISNSQYINAVRINGLESPNILIATEYPMTNTIAAFWRMLYEENSPLLIMINTFGSYGKDYPYLFPVLGNSLQVVDITVTLKETSQPLPFLLQHTIDLCRLGNVHTMLVYMFQSWPYQDELPSPLSNLVELGELVYHVLKNSSSSPVVLCCADGVSGCGVLVGVLDIFHSLMNYDEIDVYRTAVRLRRERKEFIPTQTQYNFLYQAASYYINKDNIYENTEDPNIYENIKNPNIYENTEDPIYGNL